MRLKTKADRPAALQAGFGHYMPLVLGCLLGFVILRNLSRPTERAFDEFGLAFGTTGYRAEVGGKPVNATADRDSIERMHEGWRGRGSSRFALLFGNSQLDAINQFKKGTDRNAPDLLFAARQSIGLEVLTINMPNATLSEFLVLREFVMLRQHPDTVLLAACFDDTREEPLRTSVVKFLADPGTARAVGATPVGVRLLKAIRVTDPARNANQGAEMEDTAGLTDTVQQMAEAALNEWLTSLLPIWRHRPTMRGHVATSIHKLRNKLLGITPQSKRRLIPLQYAQHMESLDVILARCGQKGVRAIVYIPPLRDDVETPYVAEEYATFKQDVEAACERHSASFYNLEHLIPASFWGSKQSTSGQGLELDFMHFQGNGHELLAKALQDLITANAGSGN